MTLFGTFDPGADCDTAGLSKKLAAHGPPVILETVLLDFLLRGAPKEEHSHNYRRGPFEVDGIRSRRLSPRVSLHNQFP